MHNTLKIINYYLTVLYFQSDCNLISLKSIVPFLLLSKVRENFSATSTLLYIERDRIEQPDRKKEK